jgi:hypothetical protein
LAFAFTVFAFAAAACAFASAFWARLATRHPLRASIEVLEKFFPWSTVTPKQLAKVYKGKDSCRPQGSRSFCALILAAPSSID